MMDPRRIALLAVLWLAAGAAGAEGLYVTDRLLLGVYQNPSESSPLVKSVPSGTRVEVLDREGDFVQVRLPDGTQGWMSAQFLVERQPATAELDAAQRRLKAMEAQLAGLRKAQAQAERKLQVLRDELANAKTTIKELRRKLAQGRKGQAAPADTAALEVARKKIEKLEADLAAARAEAAAPEVPADVAELEAEIVSLRQENQNLRARIEVALANLQGEKVPSPEELAAIHPSFPPWYWGLAITFLILGFIGGFLFFDHRHRRRHGGFRL